MIQVIYILMGVPGALNRWENGKAKPSPLALKQIEDLMRGMGKQGEDLLEAFFEEND